MSAFTVGDRVQFVGRGFPEGMTGDVVTVNVAGIPGLHIVDVHVTRPITVPTELVVNERDLRRSARPSSTDLAELHSDITCPRCGMTSSNPNDVREGYCGNCHDWTTPEPRDSDTRVITGRIDVENPGAGGQSDHDA